jgi:hypothetical protein
VTGIGGLTAISMCNDNRKLREFELLTPDGHFNMESFSKPTVSDIINNSTTRSLS